MLGISTDANSLDIRYEQIDTAFDRQARMFWCYMRPTSRPSFTHPLLRDLRRMQSQLKSFFIGVKNFKDAPIRYLVFASRISGIFNLGGDLSLIGTLIRNKDRIGLEDYARACVDVLHTNASSLDLPIVTISLVQGNALGGGFEAAISSDVVIAERQVSFGFPEVLFNLFPGMGAYSLLARRVGPVTAERMITRGKTYGAEELHELGVVDVLASEGKGERAIQEYTKRCSRRFASNIGVFKARRRFAPVTYKELIDIVAIWVDTALNLDRSDLRKIEKLMRSQDRLQCCEPLGQGDVALQAHSGTG